MLYSGANIRVMGSPQLVQVNGQLVQVNGQVMQMPSSRQLVRVVSSTSLTGSTSGPAHSTDYSKISKSNSKMPSLPTYQPAINIASPGIGFPFIVVHR